MIERSDLPQDLDQVLGSELAGSTTGGNELRQSHVVHGTPFASLCAPSIGARARIDSRAGEEERE